MKTVSANNIDNAIYEIKSKMYKKYSVDESERFISPLIYYTSTGRASTDFLRILVNLTERQKSTIANKLIKNYGNTENAINSICIYNIIYIIYTRSVEFIHTHINSVGFLHMHIYLPRKGIFYYTNI